MSLSHVVNTYNAKKGLVQDFDKQIQAVLKYYSRTRTNWVDNVSRYAGMGINDCARKAMDGKGWRRGRHGTAVR